MNIDGMKSGFKSLKRQNKLLIVLGLLFILSGFLYDFISSRPRPIMDDGIISKQEAKSIITDSVKNLIYIYEKPGNIFDVETETREDGTTLNKIKNYDTKVKELFTDNGIKQLESMKFNNQNYIYKENENIYYREFTNVDNTFINSNISISNISINADQSVITGISNFYKSVPDNNDILNYYAISKSIKLIKKDNVYLIDSFDYSNK